MLSLSKCIKQITVAAAVCLLGISFPSTPLAEEGRMCGRDPFNAPSEVAYLVSEMEAVLTAFTTLRQLLTETGLELCIAENMFDAHGYFEPESNRIVINGSLPLGLQQAILVHELRHADQFISGICPSSDLAMGENARAVFAMEADASATSLVVAWALREAGNPQLWDALATWPMQQDIAQIFADEMRASNDMGKAASAAFDAWYDNKTRLDRYYVAACSSYLDYEDKNHRLRGIGELDIAFYGRLCRLPRGGSYTCADPR